MSEPKFKEGDWVKEKNGTTGMTVVSNVIDETTNEFSKSVRCRFKNSVGEEVEENFAEDNLVTL